MPQRVRVRRRLPLIAIATLLVACGETGPSEQLPAAAVTNVTGIPLTGAAGEALSERVVVRVLDAGQNPLPGATITFAVTSTGASVDPATAVTDDRGEATTRWTLGRTPGQQVLTATTGGAFVQITALAGPPRIASLAVNGGNNQNGVAGTFLAANPSVIARDGAGNPVEGATVFFGVLSGGGSVDQPSATTNAQGTASPGKWKLGSGTGPQLLSAQVPQGGVTDNPIVFTATATAGPPSSMTALSVTQQTALVNTNVASAPSVILRDAGGNPAANVSVSFSVTAGGGQLTGATQPTNAQGIATVGSWRLGNAPGTNTVVASVAGVAAVSFNATGNAGSPSQLQKTAGDNQSVAVNRPVPVAPQVRVLDAAGNGVPGVTVTFSIGVGDGSAIVSSVVTDATGHAAIGAWVMGSTPGLNTLFAQVVGLGNVMFSATATGGAAASMQPISVVTQNGIAGQNATSNPTVVVRDAQGNGVSGITVTFAVTLGGGSVTGPTQVTDAQGVAMVTSWTFGAAAGLNTVTASTPGIPNVTFNATTTGLPTTVMAFGGNNQAAVQGTAVLIPPSVRVTDVNGQGVGGIPVTFAVTGGGGSITGPAATTDITGVASVGSWTLGATSPQTLSATVAATVAGNPVPFTASAATQVAVTSQPPANANSGASFTVVVQLRDAANALSQVTGLPLTITIASGGGTLGGVTTVNSALGVASFTVSITGTAGARTLRIAGAGVGNVVTTTVTLP